MPLTSKAQIRSDFETFDHRAKLLDEAVGLVMEHFLSDRKWLPLASSTLSRVGINLNSELEKSKEQLDFRWLLFLRFYLKNLLRFMTFVFELCLYKIISCFHLGKEIDSISQMQVVETFLMTNRIEKSDFSDRFADYIDVPYGLERCYFGTVFGGGLFDVRSRLRSAFIIKQQQNFIVHYEILSASILLQLFLNICSFPILLHRMYRYISILSVDAYIKEKLKRRLLEEMLENKVDILTRYYTGLSIRNRLNVKEMIAWSENQVWHKVFFRGMSDSGFDLNQIAAFEFFNVNIDSRFATYRKDELKYRCIPGTLLAKGQYFVDKHSHHNPILAYAHREAYIQASSSERRKISIDKNRAVGIVLPYSITDSLYLIGLGQILEESGVQCCYRLHPNNQNVRVLKDRLTRKVIHDGPVHEFLPSLRAFIGSGSGMCLEAMVLGIPVFVPQSHLFSHPLPKEFFEKKWWTVTAETVVNDLKEVIKNSAGEVNNQDDYSASYFFEPPRLMKINSHLSKLYTKS